MYNNKKNSLLKHWDFILLDIIVLQVVFVLSYMIRNGFDFPYDDDSYLRVGFVLVLMDLLVMLFNESYKNIIKRGPFAELVAVIKHVSITMVCLVAYMFVVKVSSNFSRMVFMFTWGFGIVAMWCLRMLLKQIVRSRVERLKDRRSVVLVTSIAVVSETIEAIKKIRYRDYRINAVVLLDDNGKSIETYGVQVLNKKTNVIEYLQKNVVDEVLVNLPDDVELPSKLMEACVEMGITIHVTLSKIGKLGGDKLIESFAGYTVMTSCLRMASLRQAVLKRCLDILGGIVGVILTGILCIFVGPAIYSKSPGPIFFAQERVGMNGRKFKIYKFRSMYMDAEKRKKELMEKNEMNGLMFKMKDDPRIIKGVGHFIRKTSIDEFPQFFNVLKGDMSLVGTRPPTVGEYEQYDMHHKKRLAAKPGITGMWQVSGRSDITDFEEVVKLDTEYIENWSMGLDIKILLKTVAAVFTGSGSV